MTVRSSWPGPTGQTGTTEARKAISGLFASDSTGAVRAGVLSPVNTQLLVARTDLNVDIAALQAVAVQFGGAILIANDGVVQLPSPLVSPPAGINYYVVYAKQNESVSPGTDPNNTPVVGAALSTSDFATARTSMPTGAVEIGTVQIPSGVTATNASGVAVTTTATYTAAAGGVVLVRNATELAAWTPADSSLAFRLDTGTLYTRAGGAWSPSAGVMPVIDVVVGTSIAVASGGSANVNLWSAPGSGQSIVQPAGTEWFTYNPTTGDITCVKAGRYQITARLAVQPASGGAAQAYLIRGGSPTDVLTLDSVNAHSSQQTMLKLDVASVLLVAGASLRVWISSVTAALTVGGTARAQGEFSIRYLGPS
ncbi:MAG: hypothetical protein J0I33_07805 [Microbacterium ginsengisoli]|jgi:hypothetical protein|uniref:hypothetical protein n=3 Tax=Microbacteriaceae TaxID=85023 RepID=UPI0006FD66A2|nr:MULTISPECIES: hypothetical protein [unclassified Microbacterium]KQR97701.1 hypothetical protein ASF93_13310 [Microbacterium sp. Leaf347]MBN9198528.1 hypothetical protein [Microbacterium ginsengisoli]OJU78088.1 MAG: hypothetical protein BGO15_02490 [Microbacterium sp. 71-23]